MTPLLMLTVLVASTKMEMRKKGPVIFLIKPCIIAQEILLFCFVALNISSVKNIDCISLYLFDLFFLNYKIDTSLLQIRSEG